MSPRISIGCALVVAGCGGSTGKLVNVRQDLASFVTDRDPMLVDTGGGLVRIRLDGSDRETIAGAKYHLLARTPDGGMLAFGDSDTNLYVESTTSHVGPTADGGSIEGRLLRRVRELDDRTGSVAFRADGAVLAATKHADFSDRQSQWGKTENDSVWLVDVTTLAVDVIPKSRDELVTRLQWAPDGKSLYLDMFSGDVLQLDLATRARTKVAEWPVDASRARDRCLGAHIEMKGWRGDNGFDVIDAQGIAKHLVMIEGRSRGFHDYMPTIGTAEFTKSCKDIVFTYLQSVWVVDVATGVVGHLISGGSPILLDAP